MHQAHVFISGQVQGVGYRQFIKTNAKQLGVGGWVQNTEDGGVEAVFQGDKEEIERLLEICRKGPMLAEVKHVGFDWEEPTEFETFEIH
ncbi:MAG TPA: acylphosphatase [Candidatus Saccharimonadales bacterium]|nr:acylphosphatase [Candidatus Saccharimonadales bacterium]